MANEDKKLVNSDTNIEEIPEDELNIVQSIINMGNDIDISNQSHVTNLLNLIYTTLTTCDKDSYVYLALMDCIDNVINKTNKDKPSNCKCRITGTNDNHGPRQLDCLEHKFTLPMSAAQAAMESSKINIDPNYIRQFGVNYQSLPFTIRHFLSHKICCPNSRVR